MDGTEQTIMFAILVLMIIYIFGVSIVVRDRCNAPNRPDKDANPIDAWTGALWPLKVFILLCWIVIKAVNNILMGALLFLGIKYKVTKMYKVINEFCDERI